MRHRFWTVIGVLLTMAMVVLSAFINYDFGYSLGTTETNARIFGAVSVVAVGVMAVLPLRVSAHWSSGRKLRAGLGVAVFVILVAYAVASSIGFGMQNRSHLAGSREALNAQLKDFVAERDQAAAALRALDEHQPRAAVNAKVAGAKRDRRWDLTQGCTNVTAATSREFCQGIDRLLAELATAATAASLEQKIEVLSTSIDKLRQQGAGQIADPQSYGLALVFRVEQDVVRTGLSILLALVIESVCCFGLLVIIGGDPRAKAEEGITLPEWIGKWLADRVEPHPTARVHIAALEEDFRSWVEGRSAPKMSSHKFARLICSACKEVGLSIEGQMVVGLRLTSVHRMLAAA